MPPTNSSSKVTSVSDAVNSNFPSHSRSYFSGYQEDNFATDSLHLTLGLLKTLDHHGFSLLTSLSLASRSRVKDLWIFSGVHPGDNFPDTSMTDPTASSVDLKKEITPQTHATNVLSPSPLSQSETDNCHPRKLPNPPGHNPENNRFPPHARSASDSAVPSLHKSFHFSKGYTALLRRTPRKQTHVSDAHDLEYPLDQSLFPNVSPDKSPSVGSVDLTGIGLRTMDRGNCTPDAMRNTEFRPVIFCPQPERTMFPLLSQSSPYPVFQNSGRDRRASNDSRPTLYPQDTSRHRPHSSEGRHFRSSSLLGHPGYSPRVSSAHPQSVHAPPPLSRTVSGQDVRPVPPTDGLRSQKEMGNTPPEEYEFKLPEFGRSSTPPLNSAVRDSAFSSGIRQSFNIPITWTGKSPEPLDHKLLNGFMEKEGDHWSQPPFHPSRPEHDRVSIGPLPPGGWTSTPRDERGDISTMFPPTIREQPSLEREDRGSPRNTEDVTLGVHMGTVPSRSPERIDPDLHGVRKSEAASIGVLPNGKSPKNRPNSKEKGKEKQKPVRRDTVTSGWVMVNVESHGKSKESNGAETASGDKKSRTSSGKKPAGLERPEHARSVSDSRVLTQSTSPQSGVAPSSMSAAAKAIVMIDAQGSKEHQEKSGAKSGLRKLLDRGKAAVTANDSTSPGENSRATLQRKTPETSGMNGNASKSTTLKEPRRNKAATITKTKVKRRVT